MTLIRRRSAILIACLLTVPAAEARSQLSGTLEGIVRDARGPVTGAHVAAIDSLTNERRRAVTNDRGFFRMIGVSSGHYTVTAIFLGLAPMTQTVAVASGERARVDFLLGPATTLDAIRVHESPSDALDIQRMSVSATLHASDIEKLPLNSRNIMNVPATAPGLRSFQLLSGNAQPSAGALRNERAVNLYIDGVEMKNMNSTNVVGGPLGGTVLPVDALQELTLLLNPYDAEYTRGASYIISAVTQRGTNEMHGSAFGFFQNQELNAVNDFQRAIANFQKPDDSRAQLGFNLRGPLVRNRLFYALSYESTNDHDHIAVVPGRPAADPAQWDHFAGVFDAPRRNDAAIAHITWNANETNSLEAVASSRVLNSRNGFGGLQSYESAGWEKNVVRFASLRHRWLPAAGLANELSAQYVLWDLDEGPDAPGPLFTYIGMITLGGGNGSGVHETQLRAIDRLTYAAGSGPGSHLLKLGAELSRMRADQFTPGNSNGNFRYPSAGASPSSVTISVGVNDPFSERDAATSMAGWVVGVYLNDEWHATQRLTVNAGVRYDAEPKTMNNDFTVPWASDTSINSLPSLRGLLNRGDRKDDLDNISPRLSFSWDVTGSQRTFVRGGFGVMYDRIPGFIPNNEKQAATWRNYQFNNPKTTDPDSLRRLVVAGGGSVAPAISLLPHRMDVPENRQWSVGFGHQLSRRIAVNVDYMDQTVRHLYAPVNLNWQDSSSKPFTKALTPKYAGITAWGDFARASYRALLTTVGYSRDTTLRITLAHTLASAKADWDVQTNAVPVAVAGKYYVLQRTSNDERNRLVLSGSTQWRHGLGVSAVATAASPRPYRTILGPDVNKNSSTDDDWIDGSRYQVPPNSWKYWYRVLDMRVTQRLGVARGGVQVSLIGEAFNVFNSQNYSTYSGTKNDITGARRADFGMPTGIFATRQLQVGTRVQF